MKQPIPWYSYKSDCIVTVKELPQQLLLPLLQQFCSGFMIPDSDRDIKKQKKTSPNATDLESRERTHA
jgi:hypothetical protein